MLDRVYIEIGNVCTLKCDFCPGTSRPERRMTVEEFRHVCREVRPHCKEILLHVMGEPLYHPALSEILSVAREEELRVSVTTNGTLLGTRGGLLLENSDVLHRVSISLHSVEGNGSDPARGEYLNTAIAFAKKLAQKGVNAVFRLWNLDTDEREGKNESNASVEEILHEAFPGEWLHRYSGYRIAYRTFLEYDGIFTWPSESEAEGEDKGTCHALSSQIAVLADGTVVPCCLDAEGQMPLGNIFTDPLDKILASDMAVTMLCGFREGRIVHPVCKKCTYRKRFSRR